MVVKVLKGVKVVGLIVMRPMEKAATNHVVVLPVKKEKDILLVALHHQPVKLKVKVRNGGRKDNVADYFEKRPQKRNG